MAEKEAICAHCGAALEPGSQFCGECGGSIEREVSEPSAPAAKPAVAKPAPAAEAPNLARTMLGFDASQLLRAAQAQPAPPKPPGARQTPSGAFAAQVVPQAAKEPAKPEAGPKPPEPSPVAAPVPATPVPPAPAAAFGGRPAAEKGAAFDAKSTVAGFGALSASASAF
ncbi:MAG TPA: zinc-ribbon domain-containing protein, partial [Polyangiales bacterium]|nr:zinc-ribbon domain-containing protein [Polyangiales bacterium]